MTFFLDNNFSPRCVRALAALGEPVIHLKDKFDAGCPDEEWIPQIGKQGLVLVSADFNITKKPHLLEILRAEKVPAFFFVQGYANLGLWVQAHKLIGCWPELKKLAGRCSPGDAFRVTMNGSIEPFVLGKKPKLFAGAARPGGG